MAARPPLVLGADGLLQALQSGDTLASGLRIEKYTGTCNASGVATITWSTAFKSTPLAFLIPSWNGNQEVTGQVTATTPTGCTVQGMVSQPTVILNGSPFSAAPSGTVVTVAVIGT